MNGKETIKSFRHVCKPRMIKILGQKKVVGNYWIMEVFKGNPTRDEFFKDPQKYESEKIAVRIDDNDILCKICKRIIQKWVKPK